MTQPAEHVHVVVRPEYKPEDFERMAILWYQTSGVKISQLQSQIMQLWPQAEIMEALRIVMAHPEFQTQFKYKDAQYRAVEYVLAAGPNSLDRYIDSLKGDSDGKLL